LGIGDWGLGIGDWGLGIGPNPQSPIPNPQSPIPNDYTNSIFNYILNDIDSNRICFYQNKMNKKININL
jgi:hypothetical protein